ncbi:MAG TPA: hypothetical protein PL105_19900, partial [Caldilineaceae bacterium]|nr:hypothetical protein [Caldilineaceae bacterium]
MGRISNEKRTQIDAETDDLRSLISVNPLFQRHLRPVYTAESAMKSGRRLTQKQMICADQFRSASSAS